MRPQHLVCFLLIALASINLAQAGRAYCTYHNYYNGESLGDVSCSDGGNGLMTRFGYTTISPMFPYVAAFSGAGWNSPNCGLCIQLQDEATGSVVHITVIDQCGGPPGGYDAHFDIAPDAFNQLFGGAGQNAGHGSASWSVVASSQCQGNAGNNGGNQGNNGNQGNGNNNGNQGNQGNGHSSTRCGADWGSANSQCGSSCSDDGPCGGGHCYASLDMGPCNGGGSPPPPPPPPQNNGNNGNNGNHGASAIRCGADWGSANSQCGTPCTDDGPCGGGHCYASLDMGPCNGATADLLEESYGVDDNVNLQGETFDAATVDTSSQYSTTQSSDTPAGIIAIIVICSIVLVLAVVVIIQLFLLTRAQANQRI